MYIGLHAKYLLFLSGFNKTWSFAIHFQNVLKYQNVMTILQVGAEFFHVDRRKNGQTDITKLIVAFPYFASAPKIRLHFKKRYLLLRSLQQSEPGSSVSIVTDYGLDRPGIESQWRQDFPHLSRQALGPTQPPVQCVPCLSRG